MRLCGGNDRVAEHFTCESHVIEARLAQVAGRASLLVLSLSQLNTDLPHNADWRSDNP